MRKLKLFLEKIGLINEFNDDMKLNVRRNKSIDNNHILMIFYFVSCVIGLIDLLIFYDQDFYPDLPLLNGYFVGTYLTFLVTAMFIILSNTVFVKTDRSSRIYRFYNYVFWCIFIFLRSFYYIFDLRGGDSTLINFYIAIIVLSVFCYYSFFKKIFLYFILFGVFIYGYIVFNINDAIVIHMIVIMILLSLVISQYNYYRYYKSSLDSELVASSAQTDYLTKLMNRNGLATWLDTQLKKENPMYIIVGFFDIDNFKMYNDQYGHILGDDCLVRVADAVKKTIGNTGVVCRYGGEEIVTVSKYNTKFSIDSYFNEVIQRVEKLRIPAPTKSKWAHITISGGVAWGMINSYDALYNIINKADEALYQSKSTGKNKVTMFVSE